MRRLLENKILHGSALSHLSLPLSAPSIRSLFSSAQEHGFPRPPCLPGSQSVLHTTSTYRLRNGQIHHKETPRSPCFPACQLFGGHSSPPMVSRVFHRAPHNLFRNGSTTYHDIVLHQGPRVQLRLDLLGLVDSRLPLCCQPQSRRKTHDATRPAGFPRWLAVRLYPSAQVSSRTRYSSKGR
jgi:hypothetical protein